MHADSCLLRHHFTRSARPVAKLHVTFDGGSTSSSNFIRHPLLCDPRLASASTLYEPPNRYVRFLSTPLRCAVQDGQDLLNFTVPFISMLPFYCSTLKSLSHPESSLPAYPRDSFGRNKGDAGSLTRCRCCRHTNHSLVLSGLSTTCSHFLLG